MKVCVLGSGSSGNAIYLEQGGFGILVDAGLTRKETAARLAAIGASLDGVRAVLVSHEHHDHVSGLPGLSRDADIRVCMSRLTAQAILEREAPPRPIEYFSSGSSFDLGPFMVLPFPVPHDASDPVGFLIAAGGCRVGIATDLGSATGAVRGIFRGCRAVVIEANHDLDLLGATPRPQWLKRRIESDDRGHLSNAGAAELISSIASEALADIFLAHLSRECNRPELAREAAERAVRRRGFTHIAIRLTWADRVSEVVEYHDARATSAAADKSFAPGVAGVTIRPAP